MTKSAITKTWIAGLIVFAAGIVVAIVGVFLLLAYGGTFTKVDGAGNYNFTPDLHGVFWTTVAVIVAGGIVALAGGIVQLAAWIGGLVNSYALVDKTWFLILLVGGLLSVGFAPIGFAVMVAYVIAAPEALRPLSQPPPTAPSTGPLVPTT